MGLEGLRMLEEFPDPASIQILVSRAPVSRRVTILFDLVERWWPASTDDADVQKAKREITSDVAMRNLLAHGYQRDREFHLGRGDAQKFTPTQVLRVAERLHRKAYTLEGLVYTWLGRAPMPAQ
jgi:hypothetical protein